MDVCLCAEASARDNNNDDDDDDGAATAAAAAAAAAAQQQQQATDRPGTATDARKRVARRLIAPAGATRAVEVRQGPSNEELLESFGETLEDVFERFEDVTNSSQGGASRDRLLQRNELSDLGKKVKELVHRGLMCDVAAADVVRLLDVLGTQMGIAEGVDIGMPVYSQHHD